MVYGLHRRNGRSVQPERAARVGVDVEPREVARGYVHPDPVARPEQVRGREQLELQQVDFPGLHQLPFLPPVSEAGADDRVGDIDGKAVGVAVRRREHLDQLCRKVGVHRGRGDPQPDGDRPGGLDVLDELGGLEGQHVRPGVKGDPVH